MRLFDIDEMLAVRRQLHPVVQPRMGEPHVVAAVQRHAVQLYLHRRIARARRVPEQPRRLVDLHHVHRVEPVARQRCQQLARKVVEIEIAEVVALRRPDEAITVLEEARRAALRP